VDELSYQIRRVAPSVGWYGAVWQTPSETIWNDACYDSRSVYIEEVRKLPASVGVKNLYIPHATFNEPDLTKPRNPPRFHRRIPNLHSTRTLVIDGDVKPGAFSSTAECKQAVWSRLADIGLKPSFIVYTGAPLDPLQPVLTSGMHVYLTMTHSPPLDVWKAIARALVAALKHRGLIFDAGVSTDPVRLVRPIGSLNRKLAEARIARLDPETRDGPDYDPDWLLLLFEQAGPPGQGHNNPPPDPDAPIDLAAVASAADYLFDHGHYGPGLYFHLRDLFFGLAQLGYERPDLHDGARQLFERIAVATGRDHARTMTWFDGAADRAPTYAGQARRTLASTFHSALQLGWRPPRIEDSLEPEQHQKLYALRCRLAAMFADGHDRIKAAKQAARMVSRIEDERVLGALAPALAIRLARDDWDEPTILDAIECATGRRDAGLAKWAQRLRRSAS
jgi:hypothetical protein